MDNNNLEVGDEVTFTNPYNNKQYLGAISDISTDGTSLIITTDTEEPLMFFSCNVTNIEKVGE